MTIAAAFEKRAEKHLLHSEGKKRVAVDLLEIEIQL